MTAHFAFMGTSGQVHAPQRFSPEELLSVLGANSGNLIFQYAAARIIDAPQVHFGLSDTAYSDRHAIDTAQALVFPAANHLRAGADWSGLNRFLEDANKPLIVLGLGAQASGQSSPQSGEKIDPQTGAPTDHTSPADPKTLITALTDTPSLRRMLDIFRERALFVSVRGAFSAQVCAGLGLPDVVPLGCPSALLNPNPGLGRALSAQFDALRQMPHPQIAITAAAPFEVAHDIPRRTLERRLFGWTQQHGGLYVQQSGGPAAMHAASGQWHRISDTDRASIAWVLDPEASPDAATNPAAVWAHLRAHGRFYLSAAAWIAAMGTRDVVLGSRAHGTMAALAAGTPGVLIAHDSRTSELAQTMHLPRIDARAATQARTVAEAMGHVQFDGAAFDLWRQQTAATLTAAFDRLSVPISGTVRALGQSTNQIPTNQTHPDKPAP